MNGHQHYAAGEEQLALADTKVSYSPARTEHLAAAQVHFSAALAWSALTAWTPEELAEDIDEAEAGTPLGTPPPVVGRTDGAVV